MKYFVYLLIYNLGIAAACYGYVRLGFGDLTWQQGEMVLVAANAIPLLWALGLRGGHKIRKDARR